MKTRIMTEERTAYIEVDLIEGDDIADLYDECCEQIGADSGYPEDLNIKIMKMQKMESTLILQLKVFQGV